MFINGIPFIFSIDKGKAKIDKTYDFSAEFILNITLSIWIFMESFHKIYI